MAKTAKKIIVKGVVQGVGFRPFIYSLAKLYKIKGLVRNTKGGVEIEAVGSENSLESFITDIREKTPRLAIIKDISVEPLTQTKIYQDFSIASSFAGEDKGIFLSPDVAICPDCVNDFFDKRSRYYQYPFVNCTNCGPRFSIITAYPYDRVNTTMSKFRMCEDCLAEYKDISSRRYHAEPVSCEKCGPVYRMFDTEFKEVVTENVFETVQHLIRIGKIIAVKGVGGYHLLCDAKNKEAVKILRQRKLRDTKPFAVMFKNLETLKKYCFCSDVEASLISGKESPIVLLKQKTEILNEELLSLISGTSPYIGAMLPYAPYQFLLLEGFDMLVFTSGNLSGEPIVYRDEDTKRLKSIADYFLIHNREIVRFVEDSVAKVVEVNRPVHILIRKSRGYAPLPLFLKDCSKTQILAFGSDLKSTISFVKDDILIQSQFLGDLADYLSFEDYKKTITDFKNFFELQPEIYVADLHPSYLSTQYAEELAGAGTRLIKVQHHKAHVASVAFEKGWLSEDFIGIALDGTGYGEDGAVWGSEVFVGSLKKGLERVGHLSYTAFPFGDAAVKEPEKAAFSYLTYYGLMKKKLLSIFSEQTVNNYEMLTEFVLKSKLFTSSTGRLFDVISFLLGFRRKIGYEGEAAVELENLIYRQYQLSDVEKSYLCNFVRDGKTVLLDTASLLKAVLNDFMAGVPLPTISIRFHRAWVEGLLEIAVQIKNESGINKVALSGGSFQNSYILYHLAKALEDAGFEWAINQYSPPNDACISVGQCAVAFCQKL